MNSDETPQLKKADNPAEMSKPMPFSARTGCLIASMTGLVLIVLCLASAQLLARGEIVWEQGELRQNRVWLLREVEAQGLGYSHMRIVSGSERAGQACVRTTVEFLLWSGGQGEAGSMYCECFRLETGGWRAAGECRQ
jgi:hypothetical protein